MARSPAPAFLATALLALLVAAPGCEVGNAIFNDSPPIELPPDKLDLVRADLEAQSLTLETASNLQLVSSCRRALEPLPVVSADYIPPTGSVEVVIGPLTGAVLDDVLGGLGTGGWVGLVGGIVAGSASLAALVMKKLELQKRKKDFPPGTVTTVVAPPTGPPIITAPIVQP